jgi:hypothetical protein
MVRGDIVGGLKIALSKGQSLQDAMQSFYNSGYIKEEIEEAAKALSSEEILKATQQLQSQQVSNTPKVLLTKPALVPIVKQIQPNTIVQQQIISQPKIENNLTQSKIPLPPPPAPPQPQQTTQQMRGPIQTASYYGSTENEKPKTDKVTVLLVVLLILLVGILSSVFFFKEEIIKFLNSILN